MILFLGLTLKNMACYVIYHFSLFFSFSQERRHSNQEHNEMVKQGKFFFYNVLLVIFLLILYPIHCHLLLLFYVRLHVMCNIFHLVGTVYFTPVISCFFFVCFSCKLMGKNLLNINNNATFTVRTVRRSNLALTRLRPVSNVELLPC